jgi:hypothetical protein
MHILASLSAQVVTLVAGFALTTVVGGSLGYWFQGRAWNEQNKRTLAEADRTHATATCRELSQLMDRRLYRMWQVKWAVFSADVDASRADLRMQDYRTILYEWNDTLNRNLAAAEIEVGAAVRHELESLIYEGFASVGRKLEARYRELQKNDGGSSWGQQSKEVSGDLLRLRDYVYALNVKMLRQIRDGQVGRGALQRASATASER